MADLWSRPDAGSERVSQVLLGTPLRPLAECGGFAYVESPDAYRGWVALQEMAAGELPRGEACVVGDLVVPAYPDAESDQAHLEVLYGTRLAAGERAGARRQVFLPDGPAWVSAASLRPELCEPIPPPRPVSAPGMGAIAHPPLDIDALLADARRWEGVTYLWGGGSPRGVDCSGFVQILFRVHGRLLRRDARLQIRHGTPIPPEEVRAGDLIFFGRSRWGLPTHVGIALGPDEYIHAHDSDGHRVEISPLAPALETFWGARRLA